MLSTIAAALAPSIDRSIARRGTAAVHVYRSYHLTRIYCQTTHPIRQPALKLEILRPSVVRLPFPFSRRSSVLHPPKSLVPVIIRLPVFVFYLAVVGQHMRFEFRRPARGGGTNGTGTVGLLVLSTVTCFHFHSPLASRPPFLPLSFPECVFAANLPRRNLIFQIQFPTRVCSSPSDERRTKLGADKEAPIPLLPRRLRPLEGLFFKTN
jgi:hypothetical protein